MKRIALMGFALTIAVTALMPVAEAQVSSGRNPWCIRDGSLGRGSWDCTYHNFNQCQFTANGSGGTCVQNPNYRGPQTRNRRDNNRNDGTWGWGGGRW